jgi:hypothetical protein
MVNDYTECQFLIHFYIDFFKFAQVMRVHKHNIFVIWVSFIRDSVKSKFSIFVHNYAFNFEKVVLRDCLVDIQNDFRVWICHNFVNEYIAFLWAPLVNLYIGMRFWYHFTDMNSLLVNFSFLYL